MFSAETHMHRPELNLPLQLTPVSPKKEMQTTSLSSPAPRRRQRKRILAPIYHTKLDTEPAPAITTILTRGAGHRAGGTSPAGTACLCCCYSTAPSSHGIGAREGQEATTNR